MKRKTITARNKFGTLESVDLIDTDGLIAVAAEILRTEPDNARCKELFAWIADLGRKPTDSEFADWIDGKGVKLLPLDVVEDRN